LDRYRLYYWVYLVEKGMIFWVFGVVGGGVMIGWDGNDLYWIGDTRVEDTVVMCLLFLQVFMLIEGGG